jgi:hypothetical protein
MTSGVRKDLLLSPHNSIVRPFLRPEDPLAYLFSPRQAVDERNVLRRGKRRTPLPRKGRPKPKARPKRAPGACYTDESYPRAVARAWAGPTH